MGIVIIILVFVFEVTFTIYCIKTKNNQNKVRSWVRIATFIIFMVFTITSLINWGFQWYLLGTLLLILAITSGVRLFKKAFGIKPHIKPSLSGRFEAIMENGEKVLVSRQYVPVLKTKLGI